MFGFTTSDDDKHRRSQGVGSNILPVQWENVETRLGRYHSPLVDVEHAARNAQLSALFAIYALHLWFVENPSARDGFYGEHEIKLDPRVKYPAQPLVKHFVMRGESNRNLQFKTSCWAGAIETGVIEHIPSDRFEQYIRDMDRGEHGTYLFAANHIAGKQKRLDRVQRLHRSTNVYSSQFPSTPIETSPLTEKLIEGSHLCVAEADGSGNSELKLVLDTEPDRVLLAK